MSTLAEPAAATPPHVPLPADPNTQDIEHLRLLSIFHYIVAAITAVFSLFPVIHLVIGVGLVTGRMDGGDPAARLAGWFFVAIACFLIFCGLLLAGFIAYAGHCLSRRRRYTLCMVVAALSCMMMPFGTVLGVFTLVVLTRPSVRSLFQPT